MLRQNQWGDQMTRAETRERRKQIIEYRKAGHYARDCAKHFGVSVWTIQEACKGINFAWKGKAGNIEKALVEIERKANWCIYIDGFKTYKSRVNVKCKTCGRVVNVSFNTIIRGGSKCPECEADRIAANRIAAEEAAEAKREEDRRKRTLARKCKQISFKPCRICGNVFVSNHKYCSAECTAEARRRVMSIKKDRRLRRIRGINKDGITLQELFQKSAGTCALCGGVCDWNDYRIEGNVHIAGNSYPSIDHIVPLSAGGEHKWENVQLAHRICNSRKSNRSPM